MTDTKIINKVIADYQRELIRTKDADIQVELTETIEHLKILKKELDDFRSLKELLKRALI
jgi:hypothetical protein